MTVRVLLLVLTAAGLAIPAPSNGQQHSAAADHVAFVVAGKTVNYRQPPQANDPSPTLLNHHFFAEIFLKPNGRVGHARIALPGPDGRVIDFEEGASVLEAHGGRYMTKTVLDRDYPAGEYVFRYRLPGGKEIAHPVALRRSGHMRLPDPISIKLSQDGMRVEAIAVDPNKDLVVRWSAFANAADDPGGIVDDLIFVFMGDCQGNKLAHSGGPFGEGSFLTHRDRSYAIPAEKLDAARTYQLAVEHAVVETNRHRDIPGLATFATTSFLDFRTRGSGDASCPDGDPIPMDKGMTDRYDAREQFIR